MIVILPLLLGATLDPVRSQLLSASVAASSSLALTYVTITVAKPLREQKQRAMLTRTFGRYGLAADPRPHPGASGDRSSKC